MAALAGAQGGVVWLARLRALGVGDGAIAHRVRSRRLHRVYQGVYAVGHSQLGREGQAFAAVLACGDGAVLSHAGAVAWWDLRPAASACVDVTAPTYHRHAGVRLHRSRSLDARDTTTHHGMPITSAARTLLDLAAIVPDHQVERSLAQTERQQLYDHTALEDVIARANGHRGAPRLAAQIARPPALTRSDLEARVLGVVRRAGLPEPHANFLLTAPDHPHLEADLYWPSHRLIVESDTFHTHGTGARSRPTAAATPPWPPAASESSDSPTPPQPPPSNDGYALF